MLNVRPRDWLRMLVVVGYHDGDVWVELPDAVNHVLQFVVAQEGLGGDGDQSADVVLCRRAKRQSVILVSSFFFFIFLMKMSVN